MSAKDGTSPCEPSSCPISAKFITSFNFEFAMVGLFCGGIALAFDSFPFCTGTSASGAIVSCASSAEVGGAAEAVATSAVECGGTSTSAFFLERTCQMHEACTVLHLASQESTQQKQKASTRSVFRPDARASSTACRCRSRCRCRLDKPLAAS